MIQIDIDADLNTEDDDERNVARLPSEKRAPHEKVIATIGDLDERVHT